MMWFLYVLGILMVWPIHLIFFKTKVYYEDKKKQSRRIKGGAILISNHRSFKDFMMYMLMFPGRKVYCLMSELVFGLSKITAYLSKCLGGILVDRNTYNLDFIDQSVDVLNKNKLLMVFPEGRIATTEKLLKFHTSYIMIAIKSGKPIIPLFTMGKYGLFKRARMIVGTPIYVTDYIKGTNPTKEELEYVNKIIKDKMLELEKMMKDKYNRERYHKKFYLPNLFYDLGRLQVYAMRLFVPFRRKNLGPKREKLKVKDSLIVVANHRSFRDPLLVMNAYSTRRMHMLVAEAVYDGHKLRGHLLNGIGCIRIDRRIFDFAAMNKCVDILNGGGVVSLFPEGHLSKTETDDFKCGASFLSLETGAKILPLYIKAPKHKCGCSHIYFGDFIYPEGSVNIENINKTNEKIRSAILALEEEALK